MPRVVIIPAYYTGVPVSTHDLERPDQITQHPSYDAAIAYWQCEYGYGEATLINREYGRYLVEFGPVEKTSKTTESL